MKNFVSRRGFTLIELLVVVLMIGILAAVALPQYQKAVLKSRFSSLMPLAKALNDSEEAYYLEHGTYTDDKTKLDVTSTDTNANITLGNEETHQYVKLTRDGLTNNLVIYQKHSPNFAGETHCEALIDNTLANWLCADSLKGTYVGDKFSYSIYALNTENPTGSLGRIFYLHGRISGTLFDGDTCVPLSRDSCKGGTFTNKALCSSDNPSLAYGVCGGNTYDNESACNGHGYWDCSNSTYSHQSTCTGSSQGACKGSTFSEQSACIAMPISWRMYGAPCVAGNYSRQSYCVGNDSGGSCSNATFKEYSYCEANVKGACNNNEYDSTSYCTGNFCPSGAPSSEADKIWYRDASWPASQPSELIDKPSDSAD